MPAQAQPQPHRCGISVSGSCAGCRMRVVAVSFFSTLLGLILKGGVGVLCGSKAMVADAVHSLTDAIAFGANYVGARYVSNRSKSADQQQAIVVGSVVLVSGVYVCASNLAVLMCGTLAHPGLWGAVVAVLATAVNWQLYHTSTCASRKYPSDLNVHVCVVQNRTNFFASCVSLASVVLTELDLLFCDPLGAVVIGAMLIASSAEIFPRRKDGPLEPATLERVSPALVGLASLAIVAYFGIQVHGTLARNEVLLVPADGPTVESPADAVLGRAEYFLIVDTRSRTAWPIANQYRTLHGDVSAGLLMVVQEHGVDAVLAQRVGKEMYADLRAAKVAMFYFEGPASVGKVVADFERGRLSLARGPNVQKGYGRAEVRWLEPW